MSLQQLNNILNVDGIYNDVTKSFVYKLDYNDNVVSVLYRINDPDYVEILDINNALNLNKGFDAFVLSIDELKDLLD